MTLNRKAWAQPGKRLSNPESRYFCMLFYTDGLPARICEPPWPYKGLTYQTPMSDTTSRTRRISHPGDLALTKQPPFLSTSLPLDNPQLKPHSLNIIMGRIKIREVKKNDREARTQQAIHERTTKGTNLRDLAILYNVPCSTLSDKFRGIPRRHEARKKKQARSPAVERSLVRWIDDMDASGFPPCLDLFKAVAARLVSDDGEPPLGSTWLRKFLNHHPENSRNLPVI